MLRLGGVVLAVAVVAAALSSAAGAALFFLFSATVAKPGDVVTLRLGWTPAEFTASRRERPLQRAIRVYLVAAGEAADVRGRFDRRLSFLGRIVPDARGRGLLRFTVPPLDNGDYVLAYWCPGCVRYGSPTFGVQTIPRVSRYRRLMGLRVELPDPRSACPVTVPNSPRSGRFNHTNGFLSSTLPSGGVISAARYEPDGSLFWKPYWRARDPEGWTVAVRGQRLDAPAPLMRVLAVRWGSGSWATASTFPSEGCWRITGRVGDVSLSYVVKVVAG